MKLNGAAINDQPEYLVALIEAKVDPNAVFMGERTLSFTKRQNLDSILKI
jgi:hypothetical protein